jgi:hypothetical protein
MEEIQNELNAKKDRHKSDFDRALDSYSLKVRYERYDRNKGKHGDGDSIPYGTGIPYRNPLTDSQNPKKNLQKSSTLQPSTSNPAKSVSWSKARAKRGAISALGQGGFE